MSERPRIVALVPAWNAEPFIERTLASLAAQTYPHLRILISDDASTDGTVAACEKFIRGDRRFTLIRQRKNLGWIGNSNLLLRHADGDYLLFGFHDDIFAPAYAEELCLRLEQNQRAAVAFPDLQIVDPSGKCRLARYQGFGGIADRIGRARKVIAREEDWWLPVHGLFRASAVRRVGGLRRHLAGEFSADWSWLVQMALRGEFERVPQPLCTKVMRCESVSGQWSFPPRLWYSVAVSCAGSILRTELSLREKAMLWRALMEFCVACRRESKGLPRKSGHPLSAARIE